MGWWGGLAGGRLCLLSGAQQQPRCHTCHRLQRLARFCWRSGQRRSLGPRTRAAAARKAAAARMAAAAAAAAAPALAARARLAPRRLDLPLQAAQQAAAAASGSRGGASSCTLVCGTLALASVLRTSAACSSPSLRWVLFVLVLQRGQAGFWVGRMHLHRWVVLDLPPCLPRSFPQAGVGFGWLGGQGCTRGGRPVCSCRVRWSSSQHCCCLCPLFCMVTRRPASTLASQPLPPATNPVPPCCRCFQVDASPTRRHGGSGLGLAICQKLCQAMGGRMWAESGGAGAGSLFRWWIRVQLPDPRAAAGMGSRTSSGRLSLEGRSSGRNSADGGSTPLASLTPAPSAALPAAPYNLTGRRVLLVEPCPMVRQVLMLALRRWGCAVCAVASEAEGMARLQMAGAAAPGGTPLALLPPAVLSAALGSPSGRPPPAPEPPGASNQRRSGEAKGRRRRRHMQLEHAEEIAEAEYLVRLEGFLKKHVVFLSANRPVALRTWQPAGLGCGQRGWADMDHVAFSLCCLGPIASQAYLGLRSPSSCLSMPRPSPTPNCVFPVCIPPSPCVVPRPSPKPNCVHCVFTVCISPCPCAGPWAL